MQLDATALLTGPRGRHLCLAVAHRLHAPLWSAWLNAARHPRDAPLLDELHRAVASVDPAPVRSWTGPLAFADAMDETVSVARGWQEPDEEDRIAADPTVTELLRPIAEAVCEAPAAQWWISGVDLGTLRYTERYDREAPAAAPPLGGAAEQLQHWRADQVDGDRRARDERPDDPAAAWTGTWWSTPSPAGLPTTRALDGIGSVNLLWEEDSFGQWDAAVWRLRAEGTPRVYEIDGPAAWVALVDRYPLDVAWSRRQDWYRVTGTDGRWVIPDFFAVARDFDAVHLTVQGYLATATRRLDIAGDGATVLAGWDPDQTWWLSDALTAVGAPEHWCADQGATDVFGSWRLVDP